MIAPLVIANRGKCRRIRTAWVRRAVPIGSRIAAIATVYPGIGDEAGLAAYAARGQRDGFTGMMAIHPRQVAIINAAFTPDASTIAWAEAVVAAFAATPDRGALQLDGRMIDAPHLKQARRILAGR